MEAGLAGAAGSFVERGFEALDRKRYSLAATVSEKDAIYRLRYRAYHNEEWIDPNDSGRLNDSFDDQPNSFLFGIAIFGPRRVC